MNRVRKSGGFPALLAVGLLSVIVSGCTANTGMEGSADESDISTPPANMGTSDEGPQEEVTIRVLYPWGQGAFDERFKDIDEKLPDIRLELIDSRAELEPLQELNAKKIVPDLIFANWGIEPLMELEMIEPLDALAEQYKFDLDRLDPSIIALYRAWDKEGRLIGMPTSADNYALFYNKEVFDLFGVSYPTDDMTWNDVLDLAKRLTAVKDGIQYRGLEMGPGFTGTEALVPLMQLTVNLTDPETGEVLISQEPAVHKYMELMKAFYNIPGLYNSDPEARKDYEFTKNTVAMIVSWPGYLRWGIGDPDKARSIDIAPLPVWPELPDIAPTHFSHPLILNKYSENKEAAFQVLMEVVSADHQTVLAEIADGLTVLNQPEINERYGVNYEIFDGKNLSAFVARTPALPPSRVSPWDKYVDIVGHLAEFAESDMNIPEFLRVVQEKAEMRIAEEKSRRE